MMRAGSLVLVVAIAATANAQRKAAPACAKPTGAWYTEQKEALAEKVGSWSNDSLRSALIASLPGMRLDEPQYGWQLKIDSVMPLSHVETIDYLKKLGATRGSAWPVRSVVGTSGVRAVYFLAQRDTALLRSTLHRMMEAGPDEGLKPDIAILEDQMRLLAGRKQLYGTQLAYNSAGKLAPAGDRGLGTRRSPPRRRDAPAARLVGV